MWWVEERWDAIDDLPEPMGPARLSSKFMPFFMSSIGRPYNEHPIDSMKVGMKTPFRTVTADPPWWYEERKGIKPYWKSVNKRHIYDVMPINEIVDLQPARLMDPKGSHCYLWTPGIMMQQAQVVLSEWGYDLRNILVWRKRQIAWSYWFRNDCEFVLFGIRGKTQPGQRNLRTSFDAPRGKHSEKPEIFYRDRVEKMSSGPYLELFARKPRPGWSVWGKEVQSDIESDPEKWRQNGS